MATPIAFTGFEFGRAEGIGTGTAGQKVFDGITGTAGTDVKVTAGSVGPVAGVYVGEINLTAKNFFWDTNTIGASKTVLVVSMRFRLTSLPSGDTDIISMDTAASTDRAGFFYKQSTGKLHAWISASNQASAATINVNQWYTLQWRFDVAGTQFLDWSLDGVAGTQVTGGAASTIARVAFGNRSAGSGTAQYDDVAISVTSGDHPLQLYKVPPVLVPDTGGTAVEIGTANATARFVTNSSVDATFNSANILAATSEVPPTIGATASGVAIRTSGATNAVGLPMTSYTLLSGETIALSRIIICGWASSALGSNLGMRAHNGTAETTLIADNTLSAFTNSTTVPDWACKPYAGLTDQTTISALVVRLGYTTDISPNPGAHAVYAELAIVPSSGTNINVGAAAVAPAAGNATLAVSTTAAAAAVAVGAGNVTLTAGTSINAGGAAVAAAAGNASLAVSRSVGGAAVAAAAGNVSLAVSRSAGGAAVAVGAGNVSLTSGATLSPGGAAAGAAAGGVSLAVARSVGGAATAVVAGNASLAVSATTGSAAVAAAAGNVTLSVVTITTVRAMSTASVTAVRTSVDAVTAKRTSSGGL